MADPLLRPDNHQLFEHVRLRLVCRDPVISWEEIGAEFGLFTEDEIRDLVQWFLDYKLPKRPTLLPIGLSSQFLRDKQLRAERDRLRAREKELVTIATEAPAQLEKIQARIQHIERQH